MGFITKVESKKQVNAVGKTIFVLFVGESLLKDNETKIECAYTKKSDAEKHKKRHDALGRDDKVWKSWPSMQILTVELRDRYDGDE